MVSYSINLGRTAGGESIAGVKTILSNTETGATSGIITSMGNIEPSHKVVMTITTTDTGKLIHFLI